MSVQKTVGVMVPGSKVWVVTRDGPEKRTVTGAIVDGKGVWYCLDFSIFPIDGKYVFRTEYVARDAWEEWVKAERDEGHVESCSMCGAQKPGAGQQGSKE